MSTEARHQRSLDSRLESIRWSDDSPLTMTVATREGEIATRHGRFTGGRSDGVEVIQVDTGKLVARILPTRGMSIWDMQSDGVRFGWRSPVDGPVHPAHVPLFDPSGLGWLEGFDEFVVRCGLESNGAPEHDANGRLAYPLHGRIANLPADSLSIEFDEASGRLDVIGEVVESRLFFKRLRMRSRIRFQASSSRVDLLDDVTNELSSPIAIQMLYHVNVGPPILTPNSVIEAPLAELAPKDDRSAQEIDDWSKCELPTDGFQERVYFAQLHSNESGKTTAMLRAADESKGLALEFSTKTLPRFVVWKNTASESDGYVTGLEPATNFPNPKSFESDQGRVIELAGGECASFRVGIRPLLNEKAVRETSAEIAKLSQGTETTIHRSAKADWSP